MFAAWGRFVYRVRRAVLALSVLSLAAADLLGLRLAFGVVVFAGIVIYALAGTCGER